MGGDRSSRYTLGIDAGGTYTDAVVLDQDRGQVTCKAKAPTTPQNLSIGIAAALDRLSGFDASRVKLVSISTTLATNAIVESQGGRVGLLLIGYDQEFLESSGLAKRLPVEAIAYIAGGHDVKGEPVALLDEKGARRAIGQLAGKVDSFAVSGYFSVMNPEHEYHIRALIGECCDAPVVCGCELTSKLNALNRLSTAVLNSRLLPSIQDLLDAVKRVLKERGIEAPLMVVKGSGSMVNEKTARERPVETILSGPVASAMGGQFLSGERDAVIIDMGGTTTDIAILEDGRPWINPRGASVGGWQTSVEAADLRTIGLGGDSHISLDSNSRLLVGPRRSLPLCRLGERWPEVVRELAGAVHASSGQLDRLATEFLTIERPDLDVPLGEVERGILDLLSQGPRSIANLKKQLNISHLPIERLEGLGVLRRSGLTPTDLLWSGSGGIGGNGEASRAGARVLARKLGMTVDVLAEHMIETVVDRVVMEILGKFVADKTGHKLLPTPQGWDYLMDRALGKGEDQALDCRLRLDLPIVAIGAPVAAFMPRVAEKLGTRCVIPEHAEVGNAVGAAVASVTSTVEILVQPYVHGAGTLSYLVHSPRGREEVSSLSEGVARATEIGKDIARKEVYRAGAREVSVEVSLREVSMGKLSEVTVRACATGKPRLAE